MASAAAAESPLNKKLWRELTELKLLDANKNLPSGKFFYETSSFEHTQEDLPKEYTQNVVIGRLWLTSPLYQNHALRVELHLPPGYPMQPPEVILKTPVFHPNVNDKNRLCGDERLNATALWDNKTTLTQVLNIVVELLDNPRAEDTPANPDAAALYLKNRPEYDRKVTAMLQQNGLPRS